MVIMTYPSFTGMARRYFKCSNITPQESIPVLASPGDLDLAVTNIMKGSCVEGNGAGGWLSDNNEGLNNGAYHPGSTNLPNWVAF
jgi:hypothetical protein